MKFVLVNGRMPRSQVHCVKCYQPIETRYLREIGTHLIYCDQNCYEDHCQSAFLLLENRAKGIVTPSAAPTRKMESPTRSVERLTHPAVGDESASKGRTWQ
jgi:hypothetical protein